MKHEIENNNARHNEILQKKDKDSDNLKVCIIFSLECRLK